MKFLKRPILKSARYYAGRVRGTARECANRLGAGIWARLMRRACQSRPPGREACPLCMRVAICAKSILRHLALWAAPRIAPRQRNQWAVAGQGYSNRIQKVLGARGVWGVHTPTSGKMFGLFPNCLIPCRGIVVRCGNVTLGMNVILTARQQFRALPSPGRSSVGPLGCKRAFEKRPGTTTQPRPQHPSMTDGPPPGSAPKKFEECGCYRALHTT